MRPRDARTARRAAPRATPGLKAAHLRARLLERWYCVAFIVAAAAARSRCGGAQTPVSGRCTRVARPLGAPLTAGAGCGATVVCLGSERRGGGAQKPGTGIPGR